MRWIASGCVLIVLATLVLLGTGPGRQARLAVASAEPDNKSSRAEAGRAPQGRRVFASGFVEGAQREVPLQFEITGRLLKCLVEVGERVPAGKPLAELQADVLELRHAEAVAQWKLATKELERLLKGASTDARKAARTAARASELQLFEEVDVFDQAKSAAQKGTLSPEKFEQARMRYAKSVAEFNALRQHAELLEAQADKEDVAVAEARVSLAESAVRTADALLKQAVLVAPQAGSIVVINAEVGELQGPQSTQPTMVLMDLSQRRVRAYVEELDAMNVSVGQRVSVTADTKPQSRYLGTITHCAQFVTPKRHEHLMPGERFDLRLREILIDLPETCDLVVGLPVEVAIEPNAAR